MIFRSWKENKREQTRHYIRMELLLREILKELKGGAKNGKYKNK